MRGRDFLQLSQLLAAVIGYEFPNYGYVWDGKANGRNPPMESPADGKGYMSWICDYEADAQYKPHPGLVPLRNEPDNWTFLVNIDNKCKGSLLTNGFYNQFLIF